MTQIRFWTMKFTPFGHHSHNQLQQLSIVIRNARRRSMIWNQHVQKMENIDPQIHVRHSTSAQMEFVFQILNAHMVSNSMELIVIGLAKLIAHSLNWTQSRNVFQIHSRNKIRVCRPALGRTLDHLSHSHNIFEEIL